MRTTKEFKGTIGVNNVTVVVSYVENEIDYLTVRYGNGEQLIHRGISNFQEWVDKLQDGLNVSFSFFKVGDHVVTNGLKENVSFPIFKGVKGVILDINEQEAIVDLGNNYIITLYTRQLMH